MNTYFCNINRINEEVEDFVIAKNKIEAPLIEEEKLEKKMSIQEFLNFIDLSQNIFMCNDESNISIPFTISYPSKDDIVIIYSLDTQIEKYTKIFKDNLSKINYNLNSLKQLTQLEVFEGKITDKPYYILHNDFYI
jgi:hypothetical protein